MCSSPQVSVRKVESDNIPECQYEELSVGVFV